MDYTQEQYQQLAKAYNGCCAEIKGDKHSKVNPLAEAYLNTFGEEASFFSGRSTNTGIGVLPEKAEGHDSFVIDFVTAIADTKLSRPIMLFSDIQFEIKPQPIAPKKSTKKGALSLDKIVASKKAAEQHPVLRAIFVDDGHLVATDRFKLVVLKSDDHAEYDGEILQFDALVDKSKGIDVGEERLVVAANYLPYKRVLPKHPKTDGAQCNIDDMLAWANGAQLVYGNLLSHATALKIQIGDKKCAFGPTYLIDVLRALKANGAKSVELFLPGEDRISLLTFYTDNGHSAVLTPFEGAEVYASMSFSTTQNTDTDGGWLDELDAPAPERKKRTALAIDIETFSSADIKEAGVYAYAESSDFEILLFAYAFDKEPVQVVDIANGETLPLEVLEALIDPTILKTAYNAAFERTCIAAYFHLALPAEQWECTMVKAAMLGYPFGLGAVAKAMNLPQEKMMEGKALIRFFCQPCKPTKTNSGRERNICSDDVEKWSKFKDYCEQDVTVERAIRERINHFTIPQKEKKLWVLDQKINDLGVMVDLDLVHKAMEIDGIVKIELSKQISDITGINNPNSAAQLKEWLSDETSEDVTSLTKDSIEGMLVGDSELSDDVISVLQVRQEMAKTSTSKYEAMYKAAGKGSRVRGLLQFYGANRTGRWAGRLVQVQNLPQNHIEDLDLARSLVKDGDADMLALCYGNVPDTLSQLIRTAFIAGAAPGDRFIVADFSAIEARVIAWVADEKWRQEVFATHGKIYEASASAMFNVPIESVTKGSTLRQKGKVAELALGYQGGANALKVMGALSMGIGEDELQDLVDMWRNANRAIVRLWNDVNATALKAIKDQTSVSIRHNITFSYRAGALHITLPSGRSLVYQSAHIGVNRFGKDSIAYMGMDQKTKQWCELETYGGKLVENIVQAIARDCLAEAMMRLDAAGYQIVMHIHDEAVIEATHNNTLPEACEIMGRPIEWAPGLLLRADGYETPYYKKD